MLRQYKNNLQFACYQDRQLSTLMCYRNARPETLKHHRELTDAQQRSNQHPPLYSIGSRLGKPGRAATGVLIPGAIGIGRLGFSGTLGRVPTAPPRGTLGKGATATGGIPATGGRAPGNRGGSGGLCSGSGGPGMGAMDPNGIFPGIISESGLGIPGNR